MAPPTHSRNEKHALILTDESATHAPRVRNSIELLRRDYGLTVIAAEAPDDTGANFIEFDPPQIVAHDVHWRFPPPVRKLLSAFHRFRKSLENASPRLQLLQDMRRHRRTRHVAEARRHQFDLILVHHIWNLPSALAIAAHRNTPVVLNAHEYYPRQFDNDPRWTRTVGRYREFVCRHLFKRLSLVLAVGDGIAHEYQSNFGAPSVVYPSAKPYFEAEPRPTVATRIRMIHHGIANPNRELELMVQLMDDLDERFTLDLMLVPSPHFLDYFDDLRRMSDARPNVRVIDPVPLEKIVPTISQYDIFLCLLKNTSFNLEHCLPNKFFEAVQARLAIACGPNREMASRVNSLGLGVVSASYSPADLADQLRVLQPSQIDAFKGRSNVAAKNLSLERYTTQVRQRIAEINRI